jgi:hypothetical protein
LAPCTTPEIGLANRVNRFGDRPHLIIIIIKESAEKRRISIAAIE